MIAESCAILRSARIGKVGKQGEIDIVVLVGKTIDLKFFQ